MRRVHDRDTGGDFFPRPRRRGAKRGERSLASASSAFSGFDLPSASPRSRLRVSTVVRKIAEGLVLHAKGTSRLHSSPLPLRTNRTNDTKPPSPINLSVLLGCSAPQRLNSTP